jgi:hypothetical protein
VKISWLSCRNLKIRHLNTRDHKFVVNDISVKIFGFSVHLHGLTLDSWNFKDKNLIVIANGCPNLKELTIEAGGRLLTDVGVTNLAESCRGLEGLIFSGNDITDFSIQKLGEICPAMKKLHLPDCRHLIDGGIIMLGSSFPDLNYIDLSRNPSLTDTSMSKLLADICPNIKKLDLYGCHRVTDIRINILGNHALYLADLNLSEWNITDISMSKVTYNAYYS